MGDMADALTEQGQNAWWAHQHGDCGDDYCQYCEEEEAQRAKWREQKQKQRKRVGAPRGGRP